MSSVVPSTAPTLKLLAKAFEKTGIVELSPEGEVFNPELHEAMVSQPSAEHVPNTVMQVILNIVDFKMNVQEAVNFPRIHHQWLPDELRVERGFSPDTIALLEQRMHKVTRASSQGEVAAILYDGQWLQGAADPRTESTAEGF